MYIKSFSKIAFKMQTVRGRLFTMTCLSGYILSGRVSECGGIEMKSAHWINALSVAIVFFLVSLGNVSAQKISSKALADGATILQTLDRSKSNLNRIYQEIDKRLPEEVKNGSNNSPLLDNLPDKYRAMAAKDSSFIFIKKPDGTIGVADKSRISRGLTAAVKHLARSKDLPQLYRQNYDRIKKEFEERKAEILRKNKGNFFVTAPLRLIQLPPRDAPASALAASVEVLWGMVGSSRVMREIKKRSDELKQEELDRIARGDPQPEPKPVKTAGNEDKTGEELNTADTRERERQQAEAARRQAEARERERERQEDEKLRRQAEARELARRQEEERIRQQQANTCRMANQALASARSRASAGDVSGAQADLANPNIANCPAALSQVAGIQDLINQQLRDAAAVQQAQTVIGSCDINSLSAAANTLAGMRSGASQSLRRQLQNRASAIGRIQQMINQAGALSNSDSKSANNRLQQANAQLASLGGAGCASLQAQIASINSSLVNQATRVVASCKAAEGKINNALQQFHAGRNRNARRLLDSAQNDLSNIPTGYCDNLNNRISNGIRTVTKARAIARVANSAIRQCNLRRIAAVRARYAASNYSSKDRVIGKLDAASKKCERKRRASERRQRNTSNRNRRQNAWNSCLRRYPNSLVDVKLYRNGNVRCITRTARRSPAQPQSIDPNTAAIFGGIMGAIGQIQRGRRDRSRGVHRQPASRRAVRTQRQPTRRSSSRNRCGNGSFDNGSCRGIKQWRCHH